MAIDVLTNRYDNSRAGVNSQETCLSPTDIRVGTFGKLFARTVDGDLYAQPLIVSGVQIDRGPPRNVVFLATSRNWVYAYDADEPEEWLPLWTRQLGRPVPRFDIDKSYLNFASEIGITSTPAIEIRRDEATQVVTAGTIYVVAKTKVGTGVDTTFHYTLHALDLLTGFDRAGAAAQEITAVVTNSAKKPITFDSQLQLNRPGVLLLNNVLYLAFGSHGDKDPFFGWIMAYEAQTFAQLAVHNTAPDWGQGGVWQSGTGLAADDAGFVYAVVGNGERPTTNLANGILAPSGITEPLFGNAILKLKLDRLRGGRHAFKLADWFTASDVMELNEQDNDFIGGPVLFQTDKVHNCSGLFILSGGKDGRFYLGDRKALGHFMIGKNTKILQIDKLCNFHIHGAPVVWNRADGTIVAFVWSEKDALKAFKFTGRTFDVRPISVSNYSLPIDEMRMPGGVLALSWNGTKDDTGIVWASHPTDEDGNNKTVAGTLRAYEASNLKNELWNSDMDAAGDDRLGSYAKFVPPVVANGKVYMATFSRELAVYGLLAHDGGNARKDVGIFELRNFGAAQPSGSGVCGRYDLAVSGRGIDLIQGNGDIGDEFLFAACSRDTASGEVAISARVDGITAPQYKDARAGVMIRKANENGARFVALFITNTNRVVFVYREVDQALSHIYPPEENQAAAATGIGEVTLPYFVRLRARQSDGAADQFDFIAETSQDGSAWKIFQSKTMAMDGRVNLGLAVSAEYTPPDPPPAASRATVPHATFSTVGVEPQL